MLRDTDVKKYVFRPKGLLSEQEVGKIIGAIEKHGSKLENRTQVKSELAILHKQKYPLQKLVDGRKVKLEQLESVDGEGALPKTFFKEYTGEFLDKCLKSFPQRQD